MRTLDTTLVRAPLDMLLCVSESQYLQLVKKLRVPPAQITPWLKDGAEATFHLFDGDTSHIAVICLDLDSVSDGVHLVGLIVHEVVHLWDVVKDLLGEREPSREFTAYSIQSLTMTYLNELRSIFK